MKEIIANVTLEALIDTLKVMPFLYAVYLLIEYTEHHHAEKLSAALRKMGPFGALGGALLGCIPQCGFSAAASNLYAGRLISQGTLIAVFLATSDEAIPMLISNPENAGSLWKLIAIKILIAVIAGFAADMLAMLKPKKSDENPHFEEICRDCDCEHHHIAYSALIHTVQITLFILIVNLILGAAFEFAGADAISKIMMSGSPLQPFVAALFGFIPNCAASVIITELYIKGVITFGSCIAGLCTGAGLGLLVLFRANKHLKENLSIMAALYAVAVISGLVINLCNF
jgi:hypothetical protein